MHTSTTPSSSILVSRWRDSAAQPWLMLFSRSAMFLIVQVLIMFIFAATAGRSMKEAWDESTRWWTFMAFIANLGSLYLLVKMFNLEGKRYWDILRFSRTTWKTDLLWFAGFSIVSMPIVALPREPLAAMIFGDANVATYMFFKPLPTWAFVLSFLFPFTIWFAELPTYFGYCMPRLEAQLKNGWLAWIIASFFLAAQHIFLPFALVTGLALKLRPGLLPYFVVVHALMDITTVLVYLMI